MQAIELLSAFVRSADALERIANSLELITADPGTVFTPTSTAAPAFNHPDLVGGGQGPEAVGGETKRKRRTKAEIEAEKNGQAQGVTLPADVAAALGGTPPFDVTAAALTTAVNPANPQAGFVPPQVQTPPPVVQQAVVQQPAVDSTIAQYAALPVENQFGVLLNTFGPHNNQAYVRDALVNTLQQYGLSLPISDPADRNLPGAGYRALPVEQRVVIFGALTQAINAVAAAQQPGL